MTNLPAVSETNTLALMPVMDLALAGRRRQAIVDFVKSIMTEGIDFGKVPGTNKDTLLKPGAEKLTTFFGLIPQFVTLEKDEDWMGERHGGEPFFYFRYSCQLVRGDMPVGEGIGSCNSWEKKYRYRTAKLKCPSCGQDTVNRSKFPPRDRPNEKPGWYCFAKIGGCGANFDFQHQAIQDQPRGKVLNDNPADIVNTIDKMSQKRALVAATLIAVNASEFFTQDIEDMDFGDIIEGEYTEESKESKKQPSAKNSQPPDNSKKTPQPKPDASIAKEGYFQTRTDVQQNAGKYRKFHAVGSKTYGDEWDDKRPEITTAISKGRTRSSKDLTNDELDRLIGGMELKANGKKKAAENKREFKSKPALPPEEKDYEESEPPWDDELAESQDTPEVNL